MPLHIGIAPEIGAVLQQDLLDPIRIADELAPEREKRRDDAGHMRCGHAGAAHLHVVVAENPLLGGRLGVEPIARRDDPLARRDYVRFAPPVGGRAARGEIGNAIGVRIGLMDRADRDGLLEIGRIADGNIHVRLDFALRPFEYGEAFVARCQAHHHALLPQAA